MSKCFVPLVSIVPILLSSFNALPPDLTVPVVASVSFSVLAVFTAKLACLNKTVLQDSIAPKDRLPLIYAHLVFTVPIPPQLRLAQNQVAFVRLEAQLKVSALQGFIVLTPSHSRSVFLVNFVLQDLIISNYVQQVCPCNFYIVHHTIISHKSMFIS